MWSLALVVLFTLLSGFGDAQGFIHSGRVWQSNRFVWPEALKSAVGFQFGAFMFWLALRYLGRFGLFSTEVQTLLWFAVTMVGVAALSGKFAQWQRLDQLLGVALMAGVGWLLIRTGG